MNIDTKGIKSVCRSMLACVRFYYQGRWEKMSVFRAFWISVSDEGLGTVAHIKVNLLFLSSEKEKFKSQKSK